jgi:hypothetical protein
VQRERDESGTFRPVRLRVPRAVQDGDALALPAAEEAEEELGHDLDIGRRRLGLNPERGTEMSFGAN